MAGKQNPIDKLEQKISLLEQGIAELRHEIKLLRNPKANVQTEKDASKSSSEQTKVQPVTSGSPSIWQKARSADLELLFGGNILGKLGALSVIIALGWFIKYAFDNQWVNESGRIFSGLLISGLLGYAGMKLARGNYKVVPQLLFGTALTGFVITIYMAWYLYQLTSRAETFAYLVLLFVIGGALSAKLRSQSLFIYSVLGAFALPPLFSQGENSYVFLFTYITLINLSYYYLSSLMRWKISGYLLVLLTTITWSMWFAAYAQVTGYLIPLLFLVTNFGLHFALQIRSVKNFANEHPAHRIILFLIPFAVFTFLLVLLQDHHYPLYRTHIMFAPALLLFGAIMYVAKMPAMHRAADLFAAGNLVSAKYIALAILIMYFDNSDLTLALIILSFFFLYSAEKYQSIFLFRTSLPLLVIALMKVLITTDTDDESLPILNYRFFNFMLLAGAGAYLQKNVMPSLSPFFKAIPGIIALVALIVGSLVQADLWFSDVHYRNLAYSYILAFYSTVFLFIGFYFKLKYFRIVGFTLACIVVAKLYLYDIWQLSKLVRIIAGLTLGAALIVLSTMYQKFKDRIFGAEKAAKSILLLAFFSLAFSFNDPISAESIKGYHFVKQASAIEVTGNDEYGSFRIDEEMYRHSSDWDIRLYYKNKMVPFMFSSEIEKKSGARKITPKVVFTKKEKNTHVMMIKLPEAPKGARIEKIFFAQSGNFETNIRFYTGKEADKMQYSGEKKLFRYGETEDTSIRISETDVRFVRVESSDTLSLIPIRAETGSVTESVEYRQNIPVKNLKKENQAGTKNTVIYFENPDSRKISRIRAEFAEKKFRRSVLVYEQLDNRSKYSLSTTAVVEKGKDRENDGVLDVNFSGSRSRKLKMVIENGDNDALTLSKFEIISLSELIIFALPEKYNAKDGKIQVFYGNKYAQEPRFDIMSNYTRDSRVAEFSLEKESKNPDFGFSILEPPVSSWIIRITFFALLALLAWYASKTLRLYLTQPSTQQK